MTRPLYCPAELLELLEGDVCFKLQTVTTANGEVHIKHGVQYAKNRFQIQQLNPSVGKHCNGNGKLRQPEMQEAMIAEISST